MSCSPAARWATIQPRAAGRRLPASKGYIARLVAAGYKVAVASKSSEPGKGLVEREDPARGHQGTVVEPSMLSDDRNNHLVAVSFSGRGSEYGIACCDITTGEFAVTQINSQGSEEVQRRVGEELSRLQPSELITADWDIGQDHA
ncbi:MAG: hypothetical protein R2856_31545 [Caldilineaceae bacterium]